MMIFKRKLREAEDKNTKNLKYNKRALETTRMKMLEHLTKRTRSKYCSRGKTMRLKCNTLGGGKEITGEEVMSNQRVLIELNRKCYTWGDVQQQRGSGRLLVNKGGW